MNTDWNIFLNGIDKNQQEQAADNLLSITGDTLCNLSQYGLIVVAGPDAAAFMQGQFTNDVMKVDAGHAQLNALCNNKGRMIANFMLFQYQQNYFISLHKSLLETTIARLQTYILSAQVAVQDVTEQLVHLGISGEAVTRKLDSHLRTAFDTSLSTDINAVCANEDYIIIKSNDAGARYHIFADQEKAEKIWTVLGETAESTGNNTWEYMNIQSGIPVIRDKSSEQFIPQMANMDLLDAVNFKKGCYTGQEIVARMHYLGKLKKRMYKIHIDSNDTDQPPQPGDKVFAKDARAGQNTGMLVDAQINPKGGYDALAVLQIADAKSTLFLHDIDGMPITTGTLPYPLNSD